MQTDRYISPLSTRYASAEMQYLFSQDFKFRTWRRLWIALARAEKKLGLAITDEQIAELEAHRDDINYAEAEAREREVRHDVMSHVYAYGLQCPKAAGIIHLGATSCYVGDNTDLIILREAAQLVVKKAVQVVRNLSAFADRWKDTPCLGYTHLQPAQLTTVGKRAALWINELLMDIDELEFRLSRLQLLGSKGTTGTQASFLELFGGDGGKMARYIRAGKPLCGPFLSDVMAGALRMGECNACMKRIVAAPTAGACGVLPAVLLPYARQFQAEADRLVEALYVASGFGMVIAARASISGAEGGCQAEIGSAAAMAAPALVHLQGGTPEQMANACAMAVKNLLGLVCDPVGGLVEVPCVKRNVIGAMDALSAAQMALAGIESRVPPDQVLDAMREVGQSLPHTLRETGKGGLAATPFGLRYTPKEADKR